MPKQYEYATMIASEVFGMTSASNDEPGMYLSDDLSARQYKKLIEQGFRWVRTDGERAVFEREVISATCSVAN